MKVFSAILTCFCFQLSVQLNEGNSTSAVNQTIGHVVRHYILYTIHAGQNNSSIKLTLKGVHFSFRSKASIHPHVYFTNNILSLLI